MDFDFIIVGAGSAGCVLASRLSENPNNRVLLLEAGGRDWHPFIHMPAGLAKLIELTRINWSYETEPEPEMNGRRMYWPRGKVLGGSSSINAMCYCRGHRKDYDSWADGGADGWGSSQTFCPTSSSLKTRKTAPCEYHGVGGPLSVQNLRHTNPLSVRIHRRRSTGRLWPDRRFQRPPPARFRLLPGDTTRRQALQHGRGIPAPRPRTAQPGGQSPAPMSQTGQFDGSSGHRRRIPRKAVRTSRQAQAE